MTTERRRRFLHRALVSLSALAATAPAAFAADEYTAASFTGGYVEPPAAPAPPAKDPALLIAGGQDDVTKDVTLPFEFPFFGRLVSTASVCTNGWLALGTTTSNESNNANLPSTAAPDGIVAALWDDLATPSNGSVRTFTTGIAPNRVFIVAWTHMDTFSPVTADDLSFEVKLHEGTGVIEIAYAAAGAWGGLSYTAGIEDPSGTIGIGAGSTGNGNSGQPTADWRFTPRAVAAVSGTLLRDRPVAAATGLGGTTQSGLPIAGIDVVLFREDTGEPAARTRTAADGTFTATLLGVDAPATFAAEIFASGEECRVVNASGAVHRHRFATGIGAGTASSVGTFTLGASVDAANNAIRKAVNVQQAAQRGFAWARDAAAASVAGTDPAVPAETFPRLDFTFAAATAATGGRTSYTPLTTTPVVPATTPPTFTTTPARADVHDAADNPDPWDDDVILRVCGEHVLAQISVHPGINPQPSWDQAVGGTFAWSAGFAHWFACVVQGRATFIDTRSATAATVLDLENATPAPQPGVDVTGSVACSLWDLVDPANELWDEVEGTVGGAGSTAYGVFKAVDIGLDALPPAAPPAVPPAVGSIDANSFFLLSPAPLPATSRIWIHHGLFADDAREPNDHPGEESAFPVSQKLSGLVLSKFNDDRFSFLFSPAADEVLTVTLAQTTATELDLEVLDAGDQRVAFATSAGTAPDAVVTATSDGPLPPGVYKIRVAYLDGDASSYTLAHYAPFRLDTTSLPPWTVLRPYKVDLFASGGVPPYTFATTADIPGMSIVNDGVRLLGTPTKPGDHTVHVVVTDASGSGARVVRDLTFTVNRALRLPAYFGIAADADVAADVGSGGTDAIWVKASGASAQLVLSDGPTLRLTGNSGAPRTFHVAGSATDATGAVVPAAGSGLSKATGRVVVCGPLPAKGTAAIPAEEVFGFWFDAVARSRTDLRFSFRGGTKPPRLVAVVDATGEEAVTTGKVKARGRTLHVSGVVLPARGRWFAIFRHVGAPARRISVGGRVTPPRDAHGIVVIRTAQDVVPVTFEAVARSRLHIAVLRAQVPRAMTPDTPELEDPKGGQVSHPPYRVLPDGAGRTVTLTAPAGRSGTYTLRVRGDGRRTGPVFWRVRAMPPARRAFRLFESP